jgi:MGT family glycosyltransferase
LPHALLVHTVPSFHMAARRRQLQWELLTTARAREGLAPVASPEENWATADAVLVAGTPLLDPDPPTTVPGLRYVGPIFEPDDPDEPLPAEVTTPGAPLVLVGLSTTYMEGQQDLLGRVITAVRDLPVRALGTAGPEVDGEQLPEAANVTLHRHLPHSQVLPHAALMITHAGHSSVTRALTHGVPLVCIPLGRDQSFNAERVQAIGAGLALPVDAEPKAIAEAVTTVLGEGAYRAAAQRAALAIASLGPSAATAASIVESLA